MSHETKSPVPIVRPVKRKHGLRGLCATCLYQQDGRCHRMPPIIYNYDTERRFPVVKPDDWCGEYAS